MTCCSCISGEPIDDQRGRIRTYHESDGRILFQTDMVNYM